MEVLFVIMGFSMFSLIALIAHEANKGEDTPEKELSPAVRDLLQRMEWYNHFVNHR